MAQIIYPPVIMIWIDSFRAAQLKIEAVMKQQRCVLHKVRKFGGDVAGETGLSLPPSIEPPNTITTALIFMFHNCLSRSPRDVFTLLQLCIHEL